MHNDSAILLLLARIDPGQIFPDRGSVEDRDDIHRSKTIYCLPVLEKDSNPGSDNVSHIFASSVQQLDISEVFLKYPKIGCY